MTDSTAELLAELMRARVLFQARTIAMVIGVPPPTRLPKMPRGV